MLYLESYIDNKFRCFDEDFHFETLNLNEFLSCNIEYTTSLNNNLIIDMFRPEWLLETDEQVNDYIRASKVLALKEYLSLGKDSVLLKKFGNTWAYVNFKDKVVPLFPSKLYINDSNEVSLLSMVLLGTSNVGGIDISWRQNACKTRYKTHIEDGVHSNINNCGIIRVDNNWIINDITVFGFLAIDYNAYLKEGVYFK